MAKDYPSSDESLGCDTLKAIAEAILPGALPTERQDALRARLFERLDAPPPEGSLTRRAESMPWRVVLPLVEVKVLYADRERKQQTTLWRLGPGAVVPGHPHTMVEECFVLEGAIRMGDHYVRQGDMHVAESGCLHPAIGSEGGALLLIRSEITELPSAR